MDPSASLPLLAMVNFSDPVLWAVLIGWVMSVVLHELAHGVVAYLGGDYTIKARGGLTLNPLQYVHPVNSIVLPVVFLVMGGVPLPGGVTYVRRDLLRNAAWETAVSLAGPATNFALFVLLMAPLHPWFGWVQPWTAGAQWSSAQQFLATLATLQLMSGVLNLLPIPPLDGFNAVSPFLTPELQARLRTPQAATTGMIGLFLVLSSVHGAFQPLWNAEQRLMDRVGMRSSIGGSIDSYNGVMARRQ